MKFLIFIFLPLSLYAQEGFKEQNFDFLVLVFETEEFELSGTESSGLVMVDGKAVGSYSHEKYLSPIKLELPQLSEIEKIEFRNNEEPLVVGWRSEKEQDIKIVLDMLESHSSVESESGVIVSFSKGISGKITSEFGTYFGCSNGVYITMKNGEVLWIKGHEGQDHFIVFGEKNNGVEIVNLPLGLFFETVIPPGRKEGQQDGHLNSEKPRAALH